MNLTELSTADKHLLYGFLLRKDRARSQDRKVLQIVRSAFDLDVKIEALLKVSRVRVRGLPRRSSMETALSGRRRGDGAQKTGKRETVLVVDNRTEVIGLLKKCGLKRDISFMRKYPRYFEICRAIEPAIRIIFLERAPRRHEGSDAFSASVRFLPKPLQIDRIEHSVRELLAPRGEPHR